MKIDIKEAIHAKIEEVLEFLENSPVPLDDVIHHDSLFEVCQAFVIDEVVSNAEDNAEELKLEGHTWNK